MVVGIFSEQGFHSQDMVHRLVAVAVAVAVVGGRVVIVIIHGSVEVEAGARRSRKMQARTIVLRN